MGAKIRASREFTWSTLPSAAIYTGQIVHVTDIGINGSEWKSTGSAWRPVGEIILASSATAVNVAYPVVAKTVLGSKLLPAGLLNIPGATLTVEPLFTVNNSANSKQLKIELGATAFYYITGASMLTVSTITAIHMRSATAQVAMPVAAASGTGSSTSAVIVGTENLGNALTVNISATLANTVGESATLEAWTLRFKP